MISALRAAARCSRFLWVLAHRSRIAIGASWHTHYARVHATGPARDGHGGAHRIQRATPALPGRSTSALSQRFAYPASRELASTAGATTHGRHTYTCMHALGAPTYGRGRDLRLSPMATGSGKHGAPTRALCSYLRSSRAKAKAKPNSQHVPKRPIGQKMTPPKYALSSVAPTTSLCATLSSARPRSRR